MDTQPAANPEKKWTLLDLVHFGTDYFAGKGIESPRLNIELLLCSLLRIDRIDIYSRFDQPLVKEELDRLRQMVLRRGKREPLQYITGEASFCSYDISVDSSVMVPRPETELIIEIAAKLKDTMANDISILDIGCGSGCISLALAGLLPNARIDAIDFSREALAVTSANLKRYGISNVAVSKCDILKQLPPAGPYDIVVSNPPYIPLAEYETLEPEVKLWEPRFALTDGGDGLSYYRRFAHIFREIISPDGIFLLEIGHSQKEDIGKIFADSGFQLQFYKDFACINRVAAGARNTNGIIEFVK